MIEPNADFQEYWYTGQAEITSYHLNQVRYGQYRKGDALLIFVTEPFLKKEQVKKEFKSNKLSHTVLKGTIIKKFATGIYDYSMMTSVFTPIRIKDLPKAVKITNSNQEWCGLTFLQVNRKVNRLDVKKFSYFELEGDVEFSRDDILMEDELINFIRINPKLLPIGNFDMIPSFFYQRLKHKPFKSVATVSRFYGVNDSIDAYELHCPELKRKITYFFNNAFPHQIEGWQESYPEWTGKNEEMMTTTASKNVSLSTAYWKVNNVGDSIWRNKLNLRY